MTYELRCESKLHGIVVEDGIVEIKCQSKFCGAGKGVVVLHRFRVSDGSIVSTLRLREPGDSRRKGEIHGTRDRTSVRSA